MHRFFKMLAVAALLLAGQLTLAEPAGDSAAEELSAGELAADELKVNVNKDDAATIAAGLDGVGLKRAEAIVRHREAFGPFEAVGELAEVKGIGAVTVSANAGRIELQ